MQSVLDKLENAVEDKWEEVKAAFNESAPSFREGFARLGKIFSKK
jgi:hypothetical protein